MGLFDRKTEFAEFRDSLHTLYKLEEYDIANFYPIYGKEHLQTIIRRIIKYTNDSVTLRHMLEEMSELYQLMVSDSKNVKSFNEFLLLIDLHFADTNIVSYNNINRLFNAFGDKSLVGEFFRFLINNENILDDVNKNNISVIVSYLEEARQYFVDDRALFSAGVSLVNSIDPAKLKYGKVEDLKSIVEEKLASDKKANGIYDIDQATLQEIDRKIQELGIISGRLQTLIETADKQAEALTTSVSDHRTILTDARIHELRILSDEANKILKNFNASYLELFGQQKQSILDERDIIIADIDRELENRRISLNNAADQVAERVSLELRRIRKVSQESVKHIETFLTDSEDIKKLLAEMQNSGGILERLEAVESIATALPEVNTSLTIDPSIEKTKEIYVPTIIVPSNEREIDSEVNHYFDRTIPFKERFRELQEKKEQAERQGSIYHEKFDDILTIIMLGGAPYLYGPSGCGKTYLIQQQIAELLGINVVTNGYVLYEQDIIGYTNSGTGAYVPSNFYRCFKYGDMIFYDELDAGISSATVVLNSFLTSNPASKFVFPNGETVKRHPNFRIVTAGNTKGTGKTKAHNTRQRMDESVLQRLTLVPVNYDNRIEKAILESYPGWYDFAVNFRAVIENIPSDSGEDKNTIGTFTTRDAEEIREYKEEDAMSDEQLMEYQIIENKDIDYLNQIKRLLSHQKMQTEEGHRLQLIFNRKVEERSKQ